MRKLLGTILLTSCLFSACNKTETAHWSHKACVEEIVNRHNIKTYSYTVKQLTYDNSTGDDEVYCFDITIKSGDFERRYCCYAVVDNGEVLYTDCDIWGE